MSVTRNSSSQSFIRADLERQAEEELADVQGEKMALTMQLVQNANAISAAAATAVADLKAERARLQFRLSQVNRLRSSLLTKLHTVR